MKQAKKLASLLLALVMVFALATTAFAAQEGTLEGGTVTITNAVVDQKYSVYQILYLESYNADSGAYAYKANSAWEDFVNGDGIKDVYLKVDDQGYVTWVKEADTEEVAAADAEAFAKLAQVYAKKKGIASDSEAQTPSAPETNPSATTTTVTFNNLKLGYYLVDSTLGTLCSLDTTNPTVTIKEKNETPTNVKTVEEDSNGSWGAVNDADVGQTVNFKSTITAQKGAENYVFHDKMSTGLTFDSNSVTVTVGETTLTAGTNYTLVTTGLTDGCTFEISFSKDYLDSVTEKTTIVISYSATLNKNAVIGGNGNPNTSNLEYGETNNTTTTPDSTTTTYTWSFDLHKYASGEENEYLAGAKFVLYHSEKDGDEETEKYATFDKQSDGSYLFTGWEDSQDKATVIETTADGAITIKGLDADTYYLLETEAPAGYNKLAEPQQVTIAPTTAQDGKSMSLDALTASVENQSGTELPSTGGIGTTIFYVVGGVLVVCAAVLLITKKRMSAK